MLTDEANHAFFIDDNKPGADRRQDFYVSYIANFDAGHSRHYGQSMLEFVNSQWSPCIGYPGKGPSGQLAIIFALSLDTCHGFIVSVVYSFRQILQGFADRRNIVFLNDSVHM
jgi:hypothetical protein